MLSQDFRYALGGSESCRNPETVTSIACFEPTSGWNNVIPTFSAMRLPLISRDQIRSWSPVPRQQSIVRFTLLRLDVAAGFQVADPAGSPGQRPGLKGSHELDLVDLLIL